MIYKKPKKLFIIKKGVINENRDKVKRMNFEIITILKESKEE